MANDLQTNIVDYIESASKVQAQAIKLACALVEERNAASVKQSALTAKIAATRDQMKQATLIQEHEIKTADAQLGDHGDALDILSETIRYYQKKVAELQSEKQASDLGRPVQDGPSQSKNANYTGYRRGDLDEIDPATMRLLQGFGIR